MDSIVLAQIHARARRDLLLVGITLGVASVLAAIALAEIWAPKACGTYGQRLQEALKQKARRGALVLGVAAGCVKVGRDRIEKNPDKCVQQAIQLVFRLRGRLAWLEISRDGARECTKRVS